MKDTSEDMDPITAETNGDIPVINSSAVALQQAEFKKDILHSLIGPRHQTDLKSVVLPPQCVMYIILLLDIWRVF